MWNRERKDTVANVVCIRLVIPAQQWEHSSLVASKHESVEFTNTVSHFPVARQYLCSRQTLPRCENRSQMWKDTMPEGDLFNFERFFGWCFICWELRSGSGSSHPLSHVGSSTIVPERCVRGEGEEIAPPGTKRQSSFGRHAALKPFSDTAPPPVSLLLSQE